MCGVRPRDRGFGRRRKRDRLAEPLEHLHRDQRASERDELVISVDHDACARAEDLDAVHALCEPIHTGAARERVRVDELRAPHDRLAQTQHVGVPREVKPCRSLTAHPQRDGVTFDRSVHEPRCAPSIARRDVPERSL
jgi:hypothetical protein